MPVTRQLTKAKPVRSHGSCRPCAATEPNRCAVECSSQSCVRAFSPRRQYETSRLQDAYTYMRACAGVSARTRYAPCRGSGRCRRRSRWSPRCSSRGSSAGRRRRTACPARRGTRSRRRRPCRRRCGTPPPAPLACRALVPELCSAKDNIGKGSASARCDACMDQPKSTRMRCSSRMPVAAKPSSQPAPSTTNNFNKYRARSNIDLAYCVNNMRIYRIQKFRKERELAS